MSTSKIERKLETNIQGLGLMKMKIENQGGDNEPDACSTQRLRVAVRVRPLIPKDFGREVVVHVE